MLWMWLCWWPQTKLFWCKKTDITIQAYMICEMATPSLLKLVDSQYSLVLTNYLTSFSHGTAALDNGCVVVRCVGLAGSLIGLTVRMKELLLGTGSQWVSHSVMGSLLHLALLLLRQEGWVGVCVATLSSQELTHWQWLLVHHQNKYTVSPLATVFINSNLHAVPLL